MVYIFDALRARNVIQLCLHLFFNLCILLYSILQIFQTKNAFETTPQDKCGSFPVSLHAHCRRDLRTNLRLIPEMHRTGLAVRHAVQAIRRHAHRGRPVHDRLCVHDTQAVHRIRVGGVPPRRREPADEA